MIGPILSTLSRHRTAASLIVLEIALTCAIVCNAVFLIEDRVDKLHQPSGIVEDELIEIEFATVTRPTDPIALTVQDLAALRALPGVKAAAAANMLPFSSSTWNSTVSNKSKDDTSQNEAGLFLGTRDLLNTLGVKLIAGRDFTPEERVTEKEMNDDKVPSAIITRELAELLFPGQSPIGKSIYLDKNPITVVGEIETLMHGGSTPLQQRSGMILPIDSVFGSNGTVYLLRVDPARRDEVLEAIEPTIRKNNAHRLVTAKQPYGAIRDAYFRADRSMVYLLIGVTIALLVITALGIVGLASFWVQQRTRQIGVRRALGATRQDIVRYFQVENFILATIGIVAGMALAYGLNLWLIRAYQVPRLPSQFLPVGALLLWLLGQLAVLGPALRAARISPAIATRSV